MSAGRLEQKLKLKLEFYTTQPDPPRPRRPSSLGPRARTLATQASQSEAPQQRLEARPKLALH